MNLYLGQPPVSAYYKTKLKVYKHLLQSLADRRVDNMDVKELLKRQPEAISLILKPHWKDGNPEELFSSRLSRKSDPIRSDALQACGSDLRYDHPSVPIRSDALKVTNPQYSFLGLALLCGHSVEVSSDRASSS
jgi:hypothetical protein